MAETIYLSHMFPEFHPSQHLEQVYSQLIVKKAEIDPESRSVWVQVQSEQYVPRKNKKELEKQSSEVIEIPIIIGGKENGIYCKRRTGSS